jgi:hypothetical protein
MRSNLAREFNFAATQGSTGSETTIPRTKETQQLPNTIDPQTARLNGVATKMALEEPVIERHVAFRNDATPGALGPDIEDPIDHQHGRGRELHAELGRRIVEEIPVREGEQFILREALPTLELLVVHEMSPNRIR